MYSAKTVNSSFVNTDRDIVKSLQDTVANVNENVYSVQMVRQLVQTRVAKRNIEQSANAADSATNVFSVAAVNTPMKGKVDTTKIVKVAKTNDELSADDSQVYCARVVNQELRTRDAAIGAIGGRVTALENGKFSDDDKASIKTLCVDNFTTSKSLVDKATGIVAIEKVLGDSTDIGKKRLAALERLVDLRS